MRDQIRNPPGSNVEESQGLTAEPQISFLINTYRRQQQHTDIPSVIKTIGRNPMKNTKSSRQAIPLHSFRSKATKATSPHFTGKLILKTSLADYIHQCVESNEEPEFFVSLWVDEKKETACVGIAIPTTYVPPVQRMTLEDFEEESWSS